MKKNLIIAGTILLTIIFAACSNSNDIVNNNDEFAPVRVHVDGFSVTNEEFPTTRVAENVADYSEVNAITLAFYSGNTEIQKVTQLKSDNTTYTTFGNFSLSLPMGSYTMVVLAYYTNENSVLTLTSPTEATFNVRARETFAKTQAVNITTTEAVDISTTLNRIVAKLQVVSSDGKAADVTNVRMTLSGGSKSFNPSSGLATDNGGIINTVGNSAAVGTNSTSLTYLFLTSTEQTMDVTIETLDAQGNTLFSKTVTNVPFKQNRVTTLTGAMYTNPGVSGAFQVETGWLTESSVPF